MRSIFNCPQASHMREIWEQVIWSNKIILQVLLQEQVVPDDLLEVEFILQFASAKSVAHESTPRLSTGAKSLIDAT